MHSISPVDRMSAVILAKTIASTRTLLDLKGELPGYIRRLYKYRLFTVNEICELASVSKTQYARRLRGRKSSGQSQALSLATWITSLG